MNSRRRHVVRVIEELGPMTTEEVWLFLGQPDHGSIVSILTGLERHGLISYDNTTRRYGLTKKAAMRRRIKATNSPDASGGSTNGHDVNRNRVGSSGGEGSEVVVASGSDSATGAGASFLSPAPVAAAPVASVASLEKAREALILDVEGPLGFALWVLRSEPDLYESLALAAEQGMAVPALIDVPRYRRIQVVAEAVEDHEKRKAGGPCGACGAVIPPRTRWNGVGYLDSDEPAFHPRKDSSDGIEALCSFCHDFLTSGHIKDDLREQVGNAIGGAAGSPSAGYRYRFAHRSLIPFYAEVASSGVAPGLPWAHITDVQRRAIEMQTERTVHPRRLITTAGAAFRASLPGLPARVHSAPHRGEYVAPVILRPDGLTPREEAEAMERHHAAERSDYLEAHPRHYDEQGRERAWDGADGWTTLLAKHETERKAPSLWRSRVDADTVAALVSPEQPQHQPTVPQQWSPTIKRRQPDPEALLTGRQTSEREAYLAAHPRPVQSGQKGPWKGLDGWTALLARHDRERRDLTSSRGAELRALEQRQAAAREDFLSRHPRPRHDGIEWTGAAGWEALLASQEVERKRFTGSALATASA